MKHEEIKKICNEIYNCNKCPHMKCSGYVYVSNKNGSIDSLPFRPCIPEYDKEKIERNYELMSIGINPGYDPSCYRYTDYSFHDIDDFKKLCDKEYRPSRYDIQSMRDFYHISNILSDEKCKYISTRTRDILIKAYNNPKDKNNGFYDAVYWGNVVFCPSNNIFNGTIDSNCYYRMIDIKYNYYVCKQYILRILNIIHPKVVCVYCRSIYEELKTDNDIKKFFSYQCNNDIIYSFEKIDKFYINEDKFKYGGKKRQKCIDFCIAKYKNSEDICVVFFLMHPIRDGGDRWDMLEEASKEVISELYNFYNIK